jgi:hypothetical protein
LLKAIQVQPIKTNFDDTDWVNVFSIKTAETSSEEWQQLSKWLLSEDGMYIRITNVRKVAWWSRRIARYSFLLEPGIGELT